MKVRSLKPKGQRIFKSRKRPFWIEPENNNLWFEIQTGKWVKSENAKGNMTTSYYAMKFHGFNDAYSLKAVKRLIHKWDVPKGTIFRASLPWVGYEFFITK